MAKRRPMTDFERTEADRVARVASAACAADQRTARWFDRQIDPTKMEMGEPPPHLVADALGYLRLHDHQLDNEGIPALREAILRWLGGERSRNHETVHRFELLLQEMHGESDHWRLRVEAFVVFFDLRSFRAVVRETDIAANHETVKVYYEACCAEVLRRYKVRYDIT